jgi:ribonuclease P protein component
MKRSLINGFPRAERIGKAAEIRGLFKSTARPSVKGAKLFVKPNDSGLNRIAFTLPRHYGTAVERNRTKRLCREAFRLRKHTLRQGYDMLLLLYPPAASQRDSFAARDAQLCTLCKRAGLL